MLTVKYLPAKGIKQKVFSQIWFGVNLPIDGEIASCETYFVSRDRVTTNLFFWECLQVGSCWSLLSFSHTTMSSLMILSISFPAFRAAILNSKWISLGTRARTYTTLFSASLGIFGHLSSLAPV